MINVKFKNKTFFLEEKDFQSLNSKGFGFKEGNDFCLNIYEAMFLEEKKKIQIIDVNNKKISTKNIFEKTKIDYKNYVIYKDLKIKGYIVSSGSKYGFTFRIYDKGIKISDDHALWLIEPMKDTDKIFFKNILAKNRIAHSANKKLIYAIVDSENSITYIENSWKRM